MDDKGNLVLINPFYKSRLYSYLQYVFTISVCDYTDDSTAPCATYPEISNILQNSIFYMLVQ